MKCCKIGCDQEAKFWVGKTDYDATYACGDHVEELKADNDKVFRLTKDGQVYGEELELTK